ncbi:hypothetical protein CDAR_438141 [Caerostris darwini]|uniref:Uncharacterized protein n=1 Tax=Caerostris darwini TaxID=1538125 RepID=A0AAV4TN59_9ARAC|nr:hypothetical protein CDAR_438141 [Caerostris darwini]
MQQKIPISLKKAKHNSVTDIEIYKVSQEIAWEFNSLCDSDWKKNMNIYIPFRHLVCVSGHPGRSFQRLIGHFFGSVFICREKSFHLRTKERNCSFFFQATLVSSFPLEEKKNLRRMFEMDLCKKLPRSEEFMRPNRTSEGNEQNFKNGKRKEQGFG